MSPLGSRQGRQNSIISKTVSLFATIKNVRIVEFAHTSFRKAGVGEFQPDLAFYIGSGLRVPPQTDAPIDLELFDPPTLVVEIGASSISDELGRNSTFVCIQTDVILKKRSLISHQYPASIDIRGTFFSAST